jgi:hypothetical protein
MFNTNRGPSQKCMRSNHANLHDPQVGQAGGGGSVGSSSQDGSHWPYQRARSPGWGGGGLSKLYTIFGTALGYETGTSRVF